MKINRNTPFWDTNLSVEERLDWLLSSMTVDEKLHCLSSAGGGH
jgi:beta-glucosidase